MGIYRPFIGKAKSLDQYQDISSHKHDKSITPSDIISFTRPALAIQASRKLLRGERHVTPLVITMAATDMEGKLARIIDKTWPDSGWGTTLHGAPVDTYADTLAALILGASIIRAPNVSKIAKISTALVLGQEGYKAGWALARNGEYMKAVRKHEENTRQLFANDMSAIMPMFPKKLELPSSLRGKEAMAEKLTTLAGAAATNDLDPGPLRTGLIIATAGFAVAGAMRGEYARRVDYIPMFNELLEERQQADLDLAA